MSATIEKEAPKQKMRFRLLEGYHVEGREATRKQYKPNDVIETDVDLVQVFNTRKGRKFERLDDAGQAVASAPARDEFDNMNVKALLAFIEEENKGVPEAKQLKIDKDASKAEIIAALRAHVPHRA